MTDLRKLLSANVKNYRCKLGLSQEKLAEKANTSTNYIAAIEGERRFPSVEMLEKLAFSLEIDTPELFSMQTVQEESINRFQEDILSDLGQVVSDFISKRKANFQKSKK
ncbi:hypothetical protein AGMMS50212_11490 [Spirochaetia bacterium]|nr:hypothetical protein AGMMS50212_11490 [Spirochaetia bacterium]